MRIERMARVKDALRRAYPDAICSISDLYAHALSNGRNDVATLINRDGWQIERAWTTHDDTPSHKHYRLIDEPSRHAKQLSIAI